jgi:hypothetical protein
MHLKVRPCVRYERPAATSSGPHRSNHPAYQRPIGSACNRWHDGLYRSPPIPGNAGRRGNELDQCDLDAGALGYRPIDLPPFSGLDGAVSVASLFMVVLILATQRLWISWLRHNVCFLIDSIVNERIISAGLF